MTLWQEQSNCKQFLIDNNWTLIDNQFDNNLDYGKALNSLSNSEYYYKIKNMGTKIHIAVPIDEFFYLKHGYNQEIITTKYKFGGFILSIVLNINSYNEASLYRSIITSTNKSSYNSSFSHPHIKYLEHDRLENMDWSSNMCLGDFSTSLYNLFNLRLFQDMFSTYKEYFRQYNENSPYVKIREFFNERCSVCGCSVDQSMLINGVLICLDCRKTCKKCNVRISKNHDYKTELNEQGEEIHICENCFQKCYICSNKYWKYCECRFHTPITTKDRLELISMGLQMPENIIPLTNEELGIDFSY